MLLRQETLRDSCRIDLGQVFVLGNGEHLLLSQTAERNTIFKRDHGGGCASRSAISYGHEAEATDLLLALEVGAQLQLWRCPAASRVPGVVAPGLSAAHGIQVTGTCQHNDGAQQPSPDNRSY